MLPGSEKLFKELVETFEGRDSKDIADDFIKNTVPEITSSLKTFTDQIAYEALNIGYTDQIADEFLDIGCWDEALEEIHSVLTKRIEKVTKLAKEHGSNVDFSKLEEEVDRSESKEKVDRSELKEKVDRSELKEKVDRLAEETRKQKKKAEINEKIRQLQEEIKLDRNNAGEKFKRITETFEELTETFNKVIEENSKLGEDAINVIGLRVSFEEMKKDVEEYLTKLQESIEKTEEKLKEGGDFSQNAIDHLKNDEDLQTRIKELDDALYYVIRGIDLLKTSKNEEDKGKLARLEELQKKLQETEEFAKGKIKTPKKNVDELMKDVEELKDTWNKIADKFIEEAESLGSNEAQPKIQKKDGIAELATIEAVNGKGKEGDNNVQDLENKAEEIQEIFNVEDFEELKDKWNKIADKFIEETESLGSNEGRPKIQKEDSEASSESEENGGTGEHVEEGCTQQETPQKIEKDGDGSEASNEETEKSSTDSFSVMERSIKSSSSEKSESPTGRETEGKPEEGKKNGSLGKGNGPRTNEGEIISIGSE